MVARLVFGNAGRVATVGGYLVVVVDCVTTLWQRNEIGLAIGGAIFSPLAFLLWTLSGEMVVGVPVWAYSLAAVIGYPISTFVGGLLTIDRPAHFLSPHFWIPIHVHERRIARLAEEQDLQDEVSGQFIEHLFRESTTHMEEILSTSMVTR